MLDRFLNPVQTDTLDTHYSLLTSFFNSSSDEIESTLMGSGYDEKNHSKARLWFNVLQHDDSRGWIINYNFYYAWNGCQNMILSTAIGGQDESIEFYFCPTGLHEGDLERLSLLICPSDEKVHVALYSQHNHDALYNCTSSSSKCEFTDSHIHAYSALHSHANYPSSSPNTIMAGLVHTFHGSSDGIFLVDRVSSEGFKWMPSSDLLMKLPDLLNDEDDPEGGGLEEQWARYAGWWGARQLDTPMEPSLVCLSGLREIPCPRNEAAGLLRKLIGLPLYEPAADLNVSLPLPTLIDLHSQDTLIEDPMSAGKRDERSIISDSSYSTGRGPLFRVWSSQWWEPENPPPYRIPPAVNHWRMEPEQSCPFRMEVKDGREFNTNASSWSISILVMLLAGLLSLPLILIITVWLKQQSKTPSYSQSGSIEEGQDLLTPEVSSSAQDESQVDNHDPSGSRITLIIGCLGSVLYVIGLVSSFVVLNEMLGMPLVISLITITVSFPSAVLLAHNVMSHVKKDQSPRSISHKQDISQQCSPYLHTILLFTISSIAITAVALKIILLLGCEAATSYATGDAEVVEDGSSQPHLTKHRTFVNVVTFTVMMVGGVECEVLSARAHVELILIGAAMQLAVQILPWVKRQ